MHFWGNFAVVSGFRSEGSLSLIGLRSSLLPEWFPRHSVVQKPWYCSCGHHSPTTNALSLPHSTTVAQITRPWTLRTFSWSRLCVSFFLHFVVTVTHFNQDNSSSGFGIGLSLIYSRVLSSFMSAWHMLDSTARRESLKWENASIGSSNEAFS